jgi:hypothetical protein
LTLERLRREHGVEYEMAPAPLDEPRASCVAAVQQPVSPHDPAQLGPQHSTELLRGLRSRQAADLMRQKREKREGVEFAWVVLARPDVVFADDIPVRRMCQVPGGRRVHVPWFHSRGGANHRFMMGPPQGATEYLSLYDELCERDKGAAASIPRGVNTEQLYAWHLRRRHVSIDPWALFHFVFYRVPPRDDVGVEYADESPDLQLARSPFNPTSSRWSDVVADLQECPAVVEAEAARVVVAAAAGNGGGTGGESVGVGSGGGGGGGGGEGSGGGSGGGGAGGSGGGGGSGGSGGGSGGGNGGGGKARKGGKSPRSGGGGGGGVDSLYEQPVRGGGGSGGGGGGGGRSGGVDGLIRGGSQGTQDDRTKSSAGTDAGEGVVDEAAVDGAADGGDNWGAVSVSSAVL